MAGQAEIARACRRGTRRGAGYQLGDLVHADRVAHDDLRRRVGRRGRREPTARLGEIPAGSRGGLDLRANGSADTRTPVSTRGSAIASIAPSTHTLDSGTKVDSNATYGKSALTPAVFPIVAQLESRVRGPRKYPGAGYSSAARAGMVSRSPIDRPRTLTSALVRSVTGLIIGATPFASKRSKEHAALADGEGAGGDGRGPAVAGRLRPELARGDAGALREHGASPRPRRDPPRPDRPRSRSRSRCRR